MNKSNAVRVETAGTAQVTVSRRVAAPGNMANAETGYLLPKSGKDNAADLVVDEASLGNILSGAGAGLALFDNKFRLVASNAPYAELCGLAPDASLVGITLMDLIRMASRARGTSSDEVEVQVDRAMENLRPGGSYTMVHERLDGSLIEVRRACLTNGSVVETLRETEGHQGVVGHQIADMARERLDQALSAMSDGFTLWDREDRLVMYNRRFVDLNPGIADIITPGITYKQMKSRAVARGLHDVDGVERQEVLDYLLCQHANPTEPHEMQLADGRWILVSERKMPDGSTVGTRTDVTELKRRELELKRATEKINAKSLHLDTALENMTQGLCMFDAGNRLIVANQRYLDLYGFSADVVKPGATLREILTYSVSLGNYTPEEAEVALEQREARSTLMERSTVKQRLKDGRVIAVMNEPMADGGTIATYTDITESERQARELESYNAKLEASNRELQDFAYVASHDLQEPLRKIEAFGDRLQRKHGEDLPEQGQMYIDRMQDAAGRMRRLINDLLSYSRITTKGKDPVDINTDELLAGVLNDLSVRIEETNATVTVGDLPNLMADETQMRQLFQNLIGNALKFSRPGVDPAISVTGEEENGQLVFKIADNGIGFENRFKDQIFTIFQRLHGRLEYEGTGVGLATVRKIVERHNGTIDADGRPNEGATFIVTLPLGNEEF
ncbi:MAG: PAS-domain containing protein [Pseudomonadota bacterium]